MGSRFFRKRVGAYRPRIYRSPLSTTRLLLPHYELAEKIQYVRYVSGI